jgi:LmbE family N-acetylglucosaminyl deacetylase
MLKFDLKTPSERPVRILCLGAHSDDIEIGCGGTILKLASMYPNAHVTWVVFSGNEARAAEARNSANQMLRGFAEKNINTERFRDGFLPWHGIEVKDYFEQLKQQEAPDVIFTHYRDDRHQDHRLISDLTWNTYRDHLILEYEIPKYDGDLGRPNLFVHIDETICQRKITCLMECFGSQRDKRWFTEETFRSLMRIRGIESASPTKYAEAFHARKTIL